VRWRRTPIYVLNGFYAGTGPDFADLNARPVINSAIELAEWDVFVGSNAWTGGCALNVDIGDSGFGLPLEEAMAFAPRVHSLNHGITLLLSRLARTATADDLRTDLRTERALNVFRDLRRLFGGLPGSLADSSGIFLGRKAHFDLVRAGSALYGVNPTPAAANPMLPVIELRARIVQVRELTAAQTPADNSRGGAKRRIRLALASVGYADGYPRPASDSSRQLKVLIGGHRCPVAAPPSMDLLPIDVTDLPDRAAARFGAMVTLIGDDIGLDDLALASTTAGREILARLGRRFHRIYYAT
jgi:alanine racemase